MSTRAWRKLRGEDLSDLSLGLDSIKDDQNPVDTSVIGIHQVIGSVDENIPQPSQKSRRGKKKNKAHLADVTDVIPENPFEMLNEDETFSGDHDSDVNQKNIENNSAEIVTENTSQNAAKKKPRKKKKKLGGKILEPKEEVEDEVEDEVEAVVREVNAILGEVPSFTVSDRNIDNRTIKSLLSVEHKYLNPANEMKRIFGAKVVQSDQNRVPSNRHHRRAVRRNNWLVQHKDTWPALGKTGLSMELRETNNNGQHFVFVHHKEYQKIQFQFLDAVESMDPQNLINMANLYPYHIDTLLQVSEVCRMSEDMQMATDFLERALYVFECAFHPMFSLTQGTARLDYKLQENRSMFIAIFRHLVNVGKRGCYRTALEFCKLLLSLDPDEDPLCVLLMVDFYAVHSQEYDFLIRLYQEWEMHRNLSQLPNFAMSVPLAMYHKAVQDDTDTRPADKMLQESLIMFPSLLTVLLDKCSIVPDDRVSKHAFFSPHVSLRQPKALEQLIALYVGRTYSCWKSQDVIAWLERNVQVVLDRVDRNEPLVEDFSKKRMSRYQGTPRNIYRHIMISEIKEARSALPPDMIHTPVMSYDPLPPINSIAAYPRPTRPTRLQTSSNALSMFFQSLLPNFNPQELAVENDQAVGGEGQNFREGVAQVMTAMRDLLNNIRPVAPPVENGDREDEADEEWD